MATDPKAEAAKKHMEEFLKKMAADKIGTSKLDAVIKEGNSLKGDKDNPN